MKSVTFFLVGLTAQKHFGSRKLPRCFLFFVTTATAVKMITYFFAAVNRAF